MNALSNARHEGESFQNYQARRAQVQRAIKLHLRGKLAHVSTVPVVLDLPGVNPEHDKAIEKGDVVKVQKAVRRTDGKPCRIGLTRGVTYRRPTRKEPSLRDRHRGAV